jgi:hypothetical protein
MRLATTVIVSVLGHLVLLAMADVAAQLGSWRDTARHTSPPVLAVQVELEIVVSEPVRTAALPEQVAGARPLAVRARALPALHPRAEDEEPAQSVPVLVVVQPAERRAASLTARDLSPERAARLSLQASAAPFALRAATRELRSDSPLTAESGAERLDAVLADATRNTALSREPDPVLDHHPDGSYSYAERGFKATIDSEGRVHFEDSYYDFEGGFFAWDAWLENLFGKNDIYRSRRRWFVARTASLREALAEAWRAERSTLRGSALTHALALIWSDRTLSPARRRQETLRLWDALPSDAQDAYALILAFVRARCPRGSPCAFQPAELAKFNALRSAAPFEP